MQPAADPRNADPATLGRLKWRCRRGMRELDAVLQEFLAAQGERLEAADIERFAALLDLPDPTLYAYIVGRSAPDDPSIADLIARIRAGHRPRA